MGQSDSRFFSSWASRTGVTVKTTRMYLYSDS